MESTVRISAFGTPSNALLRWHSFRFVAEAWPNQDSRDAMAWLGLDLHHLWPFCHWLVGGIYSSGVFCPVRLFRDEDPCRRCGRARALPTPRLAGHILV